MLFLWLSGFQAEIQNEESLIRVYSVRDWGWLVACKATGGKTTVLRPAATVWGFGAWWWFRGSWVACWSAFWFVIWWWWSGRLPLLVTAWGYFGIFLRGEKFWRTIFWWSGTENALSKMFWTIRLRLVIFSLTNKLFLRWGGPVL